MPDTFTLDERPESPEIDEANDRVSITTAWVFHGTNDYAALRTYVLQLTPPTFNYNGMLLGRRNWRPRFQPGEWGYVDVIYDTETTAENALQPEGPPGEPNSPPPPPPTPTDDQTLDSNWTLSTRGGTVHINLAKETRYTRSLSVTEANVGNVIGAGPSNVRGCDVHGMKLSASITIPTDLKLPLIRTLVRIDEPQTNSQPWLGMATGEWLYVGCDAQGSASGRGSVTIHLEGGQNIYNNDPRAVINSELELVSPDASKPAKYAHEFVDFLYRRDSTTGLMKAVGAYVFRVYDSMNFAEAFGFG